MNMPNSLTLAALAGMVALPPQGGADLTARVETLEQQLAESTAVRETLQTDINDLYASVASLSKYRDAQVAADAAFTVALKGVEDGGFAVGQNWQAKKDLLDGLRARSGAGKSKKAGTSEPEQ